MILFGILLGIAPLFFIATNGLIIGALAYVASQSGNLDLFFVGIVPHGVLEIPAIILSGAAGLMLGVKVIKSKAAISAELSKSLKLFFGFILPVLFVAALIEAFITPLFVDIFFDIPADVVK